MEWVGVVAFVLLSVAAGPCRACSPPMFWQPHTFMERLEEVPIAFRGKVTSSLRDHSSPWWSNLYEATLDVDCVYKGIGQVAKSVTIPHFGFAHGLCTSNEVEEGENYVIFASGDGDLSLYNANVQPAATEATSDLIADIENEYDCAAPQ